MKSTQAQVAAIIRKELKRNSIQAVVKSRSFSMGDAVDVTIYNQPPHVVKAIDEFCSKYQYGHFNGMEDIYESSNIDDSIPQTKYLHVTNKIENDVYQRAWEELRGRMSGYDQYDESYEKASLENYDISRMLWNYIRGTQSDFMFTEFMKPKLKIMGVAA